MVGALHRTALSTPGFCRCVAAAAQHDHAEVRAPIGRQRHTFRRSGPAKCMTSRNTLNCRCACAALRQESGSWVLGASASSATTMRPTLRADFCDLIADGLSAADATRRLRDEYGVGDRGADDNDFWLGLAAAQHSTGHVSPEVIERAIRIIDSPSELERWEPPDRNPRKAALQRLRAKLIQPPPQPKRLRPRKKVDTRLEPGQHVVVSVSGRQVVLRVMRIQQDKGGRYPVVVVVDWDNDQRKLRKAHRLPAALNPVRRRKDEAMGFILIGEPSDPEAIEVLAQTADWRTPARRWQAQAVTRWSGLERFFGPGGELRWP